MFAFLDKPVFTVLGVHMTIGLILLVVIVAYHLKMKKVF